MLIEILTTALVLAIIAFVVWLILWTIPMSEPWPKVIIAVTVLLTLFWLVRSGGHLSL